MMLIGVLRMISATVYKYTSHEHLHTLLAKLQACIGITTLVLIYDKKGLRSIFLSVNYYLKRVKFLCIVQFLNENFYVICSFLGNSPASEF